MELVSYCPLGVGSLLWERKPGDWSLTVTVKATFALRHGMESVLAPRQEAAGDDVYWEGNPAGSLYCPSDFVPYKPRADVLLVGHARAVGGAPVESVVARLRVDGFTKALRATGDRLWQMTHEGLRPGPARPFVEMPLRYERGSPQGDSPIGLYPAPSPGRPVPNLEPIEEPAARWGGRPQTGTPGFGPIAPAWRARRGRVPDDVLRWIYQLRAAPGPAPMGLDFGFFNSAPADQQLEGIRAAPTIVLENLHRGTPRFETRLPSVWPRVFRSDPAGNRTEVPMRCDTLWIDADRELAVLSWRGVAPVPGGDERALGRLLVLAEGAGPSAPGEETETQEIRPAKAQSVTRPMPVAPSGDRPLDPDALEERTSMISLPVASALPFARRATEARPAARQALDDGALPFRPAGAIAPRPDVSFGVEERQKGQDSWADEDTGQVRRSVIHGSAPPAEESTADLDDEPTPAPREAAGADLVDTASREELSLARWAELSAEIAAARGEAEVLGRLGLSAPLWRAAGERHRSALLAEAGAGAGELLRAHDAAYVAAIERVRGPIAAEEYARLVVGHERGEAAAILAELRVPRAALLPVEREWARRLAADRTLAERVERAVSGARAAR